MIAIAADHPAHMGGGVGPQVGRVQAALERSVQRRLLADQDAHLVGDVEVHLWMGKGVQPHIVHVQVAQLLVPLADVFRAQPVGVSLVGPLAVPALRLPVEPNAVAVDPHLAVAKALAGGVDHASIGNQQEVHLIEVRILGRPRPVARPGRLQNDLGGLARRQRHGLRRQTGAGLRAGVYLGDQLALERPRAGVAHEHADPEAALPHRGADGRVGDMRLGTDVQPHVLPDAGLLPADAAAPGHLLQSQLAGIRVREAAMVREQHGQLVLARLQPVGDVHRIADEHVILHGDASPIHKEVRPWDGGIDGEDGPLVGRQLWRGERGSRPGRPGLSPRIGIARVREKARHQIGGHCPAFGWRRLGLQRHGQVVVRLREDVPPAVEQALTARWVLRMRSHHGVCSSKAASCRAQASRRVSTVRRDSSSG